MIRIEDRYWYHGQVDHHHCGRFPRSNIGNDAIQLPTAETSECYFITLAPFTPQQQGDLAFSKGEILVGLNRVDANWWTGRTADNRRQGISISLSSIYFYLALTHSPIRCISHFLSLANTGRIVLPSSSGSEL